MPSRGDGLVRHDENVRSFWQRTGGLVSSARLRRLLPGGDPAVAPEHDDAVEIERRERRARSFDLQPTIERARAFALQSVARQSVAVSAEGTSLRLLGMANNRVLSWASEPLGERARDRKSTRLNSSH